MVRFGISFWALCGLFVVGCGPSGKSGARVETVAQRRAAGGVSTITLQDEGGEAIFVGSCPQGGGASICWSDQRTAVPPAQKELERQWRISEQLRASCPELGPAEQRACAAYSELDRAISPLFHFQDVAGVMELKVERFLPGQASKQLQTVGARVLLDPVPGLDEARLKGLVACHLARHRAMAYRMEHVSDDPLALQGIRAQVAPVGTGLAVDIRAADPQVAAEVLQRVRQIGLKAVNLRRR